MSILKEFRDFALKGSVIDLAVGVIIGAAFGKIVSSLVSNVIMPPIGLLLGRVDFSNLFINLSGQPVDSYKDATLRGVPVLAYGGVYQHRRRVSNYRFRFVSSSPAGQPPALPGAGSSERAAGRGEIAGRDPRYLAVLAAISSGVRAFA
jgi:hypothetical protein